MIGLFENPVPPKCEVERKALTRVLCKQNINWNVLILDFKMDRHLRAMATQRPDIRTHVVWESSKSLRGENGASELQRRWPGAPRRLYW
jgi:hypothetical protein